MTWSTSQFPSTLPKETWPSLVDHNVASGIIIGSLIVSLCYTMFHRILSNISKIYGSLNSSQQTVIIQHCIQAVFLLLLWPPMTYLYLSLSFEEQSLDIFHKKFHIFVTMEFIIIIIYVIELATRYESLRPVVLAHHLCAIGNGIFAAVATTNANVKASSVLVYMITFEAITFVGLIMYRLRPMDKLTPRMILFGMFVMGASRPLQLALIFSALLVSWDSMVVWHAVVQILLTIVFTSLQIYSITIHLALRRKSMEKQLGMKGEEFREKQVDDEDFEQKQVDDEDFEQKQVDDEDFEQKQVENV